MGLTAGPGTIQPVHLGHDFSVRHLVEVAVELPDRVEVLRAEQADDVIDLRPQRREGLRRRHRNSQDHSPRPTPPHGLQRHPHRGTGRDAVIDDDGGAGVQVDELRLISGGAASPFWRRLIGSAVGTPVRFVGHGHGPAMGAAVLGAAAVGRHGSLEDIAARWIEPGPVEEPDGSERERLRTLAGPLRALRTALRGVPLPPS